MRKFIPILLCLIYWTGTFAQQDTTTVQIIQFSDGLDNRRAWRFLPPDTGSYRQIIMTQTLKCDPNLISNPTGSGCGEWDTGANFILTLHENKDSTLYEVGNLNWPDSILAVSNPVYSYHQEYQRFRVLDSTISESLYTIGNGTTALSHPMATSLHSGHSQYVYKASELSAAGMTAGSIDKVSLEALSANGTLMQDFAIRMKHTNLDSLYPGEFEKDGLQTVYRQNTTLASGSNDLVLTYPFQWDGVSNIVVDLAFTNSATGADYSIKGHTTSFSSGVYAVADDKIFNFEEYDYIAIEDLGSGITNEVTASCWIYGDPLQMPVTSFVFEAVDSLDNNVLRFRAPRGTGNPQIRWNTGNSSLGSTDNVNQTPNNISEYAGRWNHWAVTKNTTTGDQKIYLNGALWASGTSMTKSISGIDRFRIGNAFASENNYRGFMNEFRLWDRELSEATIREWMFKDIDASHPQYANLIGYYKFDQSTDENTPDEYGSLDGRLMGKPQSLFIRGEDHLRNLNGADERPNITFVQGVYNAHLDSLMTIDSVANGQMTIERSSQYRDVSTVGLTETPIDTLFQYWEAGYSSYTYDANGNVVDSTYITPDTRFYNHYEAVSYRIGRYITPYGNYLDLGDGFTWLYDVTDFEPLLHDTIDFQAGDHRELIDCKFHFIKGTPPRDVHDVTKVLNTPSGKYEYLVNNPATETLMPNASSSTFGLRYSVTGHSFNNPTNCAEFCARTHYFTFNGTRIHSWLHEKECADNALYPQGGTWIYDRTGWCPGDKVQQFFLDLTPHITAGTPFDLAYSVDPDPTGVEYGNWSRAMFFLQYGPANFSLDAEVYDIIAPNDWEYYGRLNPICDNPIIEIRNSGSTTLTSVDIEYGVEGGQVLSYTWQGNLAFMETERVTLPMHDLSMWIGSAKRFFARIKTANGQTDQHSDNDQKKVSFEIPPVLHSPFVFRLKTNSVPSENAWEITDGNGNVLYSRYNFAANTIHDDTVDLPVGCYTLKVFDYGHDGLSFWNNSDGNGYCSLWDSTGSRIQQFEPDFGTDITYSFTIGTGIGLEENNAQRMDIFPNPSKGIFNIRTYGFTGKVLTLSVYTTDGKLADQRSWTNEEDYQVEKIDLSHLHQGLYHLVIQDGEHIKTSQLTIHH